MKNTGTLIKLRDRFNSRNSNNQANFSGLNILVLSNRIDGVEQFRDDLINGRKKENKAPILGQDIIKNLKVSTFHSKADKLLDGLDESYFTNEGIDEIEIFSQQSGRQKDHIMFSTYQTENLKELDKLVPYFDVIIIDEAHNVKGDNDFRELIDKLSNKGRDGNSPYILPLTATPTNLTEELFGEPIFSYGLPKYLASEYSPDVNYKLITQSNASKEDIESLNTLIEQAKKIKDPKEKKDLVNQIEEKFEEMMSSYPDLDKLVEDVLTRIMVDNGEINETVIFTNGTDEADKIADKINKQFGSEIALSYHSKNDKNKALDRLKNEDDNIKIIVAVDKLNESIDLPVVSNVVFWRLTNMVRIFLQQFGRGLRGIGTVNFYDYVGSLKNFSWIGGIYEEYKKIIKDIIIDPPFIDLEKEERESKFRLLGGDLGGKENNIDLSNLGFEINNLKDSIEIKDLILEQIKEHFYNYKGNKQDLYNYFLSLSGVEIRKIEFKRNKIVKIVSSSGWKNSENLDIKNTNGFKSWIDWLFEENIEEKTMIEQIKDYFYNYKGNKEESYNYFYNLSAKEVKKVGFKGNKITNIVKYSGWENTENLNIITPTGFKAWINWLFEENQ